MRPILHWNGRLGKFRILWTTINFQAYWMEKRMSQIPNRQDITTNSAGARESYEWTKQERSPFFGPVGPACLRQDKTRQGQYYMFCKSCGIDQYHTFCKKCGIGQYHTFCKTCSIGQYYMFGTFPYVLTYQTVYITAAPLEGVHFNPGGSFQPTRYDFY